MGVGRDSHSMSLKPPQPNRPHPALPLPPRGGREPPPVTSVHAAAPNPLPVKDGERAFAALATQLVAKAFPNPTSDVRAWPACLRLYPHAIAVFEHAPDTGDAAQSTTLLLNQTADFLNARAAACG